MTLNPRCEQVETAKGVAITVTGVAQVKVIKEDELLKTACEQFLGKNPDQIADILLQTLEGHLRAILGTLTVESIYKGEVLTNDLFKTKLLTGIASICLKSTI